MPIEPIDPIDPTEPVNRIPFDPEDEDELKDFERYAMIDLLARLLHCQAEGYSLAETIGHLVDFYSMGFALEEKTDSITSFYLDAGDLVEAHEQMCAIRARMTKAQLVGCRIRAMNVYKATWKGSFERTLAIFGGKNEDYSGGLPDISN